MESVTIKTYYGFGDNLFLYPFIKEACSKYKEVYLETHFPFLYWALPNVKFIRPTNNSLLLAKKCFKIYSNDFWTRRPREAQYIKIPYYLTEMKKNKNLIQTFDTAIPINSNTIDMNLPLKPQWIKEAQKLINTKFKTSKKICLLKPPSNRKDWRNNARIPKPEYFQYLIDKYKDEYYFVSIANKETDTIIEDLTNIDYKFENGELELTVILALGALADMIITYNCFLFPLGVVTNTKTIVINGGYSDPNMYIDYDRLKLNNLRIVTPEPCCTCISRNHNCKKDISFEKIDKNFKSLINNEPNSKQKQVENIVCVGFDYTKSNLLISRMRGINCSTIANNELVRNKFNIYTVDHTPLDKYTQYENEFKAMYRFPLINDICNPILSKEKEEEIYQFSKEILKNNDINLVLNAQPLHPYNELMSKACKELKVKVINTETFCDNKWLFDFKGCQYTKENEIFDYVNKIPINYNNSIDLPQDTRQRQIASIPKEIFYRKYRLNPNKNYIVILGQFMGDMSLKHSTNPNYREYVDYFDLILRTNPETHFIVKLHPVHYNRGTIKLFRFLKNYPNVTVINNENLDMLLEMFDCFTSFSSTTITEGIIKNKTFATMGYHFCNNDNLVIQLDNSMKVNDLYNKLINFKINFQTRDRYLRFICNYYTIDLASAKLYDRLTLNSDEYFKKEF